MPPFAPVGFTGWQGVAPEYRQIWDERHRGTDRVWEHDEAAFRYGYEVACDPAHQAMSWDEAEPYLRSAYPAWRGEAGYTTGKAGWEYARDNVREAFEHTAQRHRSEM